ncbi:hemagglutinin repeat-containing protein, partial [Escherichia coli]|uniref:hemagglutinin repeat-containing protein n=1 Tax=Escherichia coli TaxID=562 RepID=UPI0028E5D3E4
LKAGQDLLSVGSRLHSQGDLSLSAGRNLLLTTAAPQPGGPTQVSDLKAGHSLRLDAGQDLTLNASRLRADHDLALYAGNDLYSGVISEE